MFIAVHPSIADASQHPTIINEEIYEAERVVLCFLFPVGKDGSASTVKVGNRVTYPQGDSPFRVNICVK